LATRIRASYVEALEAEDFAALGGDVYAKGFLRSYAAFLGLDPEPLVEAFRERYAMDTSPGTRLQSMRESGVLASKGPRRRGWLPVGIGCVMVVLLLGVWSLVAGRGDPASAPTVAAPETTLPPAPSTAPTSTAPTTTVASDVQVVLRFEGRSWASVTVDGERAFRGILSKGAERSFTGKQAVDVALGNAGGVLLTVNGNDIGHAGPYGRSFQRTFTPPEQAAGSGTDAGQAPATQPDTQGTQGTRTTPSTQATNRRGGRSRGRLGTATTTSRASDTVDRSGGGGANDDTEDDTGDDPTTTVDPGR
jgi:hypothetical protein